VKKTLGAVLSSSILLAVAPSAMAARVSVGTATGSAGGSVTLSLGYQAEGASVAILQVDLLTSAPLSYASASTGAAGTAAGKQVASRPISGGVRLLVYGLNKNVMGDGPLVSVVYAIASGATSTTYPVTATNAAAADPGGSTVALTAGSGSVTVGPVVVPRQLLLSSGRVSVTVDWQSQYSGQSGRAFAIPRADGFGFFYFTDADNPEVFVKVLDFGGGGVLCFVGGLSNFYYKVTFTTLRTGQTLVFEKPAGQYVGFADNGTLRFGAPPPTTFVGALDLADEDGREAVHGRRTAPLATAPQSLSLAAGRVLVTVDWQNQYSGQTGRAYGIPQADGFGFFYFTDPDNPEVFVKVLDFGGAGALCFVGGLSDFSYKVTFTTLRTGQTLVFEKPANQFVGFADNGTLRY
jgi:hypothetical protein